MDKLFGKLLKHDILSIGWHLAQGDSRDDFVRDPASHADFAADLTDRLEHLVHQVEHGRYRPKHLVEVDVPKSGLSVRPGNVLPIEEASLLQAIVYLIGPSLNKTLSPCVYSFRLKTDWQKRAKRGESMFHDGPVTFPFLKRSSLQEFSIFEPWYEGWPEFDRDSRAAVTEEGYTHLTKTDISAYFENIDLGLLREQISHVLPKEQKLIQLLFRILEGWTRSTAAGMPIGRGIPQGNDISSFLGNYYLRPLDHALTQYAKKTGAKWFRCVDDVKIYSRSATEARDVVFYINEALRKLHLNLQGSKTEILEGDALRREIDTTDIDRIDSAIKTIAKLKGKPASDSSKEITKTLAPLSEMCTTFTRNQPSSLRKLDGRSNRQFRRLLTAYGLAGRSRSKLPDAALSAARELPDLRILRSSLTYLSRLPQHTHQKWVNELLVSLEQKQLLFPYQNAMVLEALIQFHPQDPKPVASRIRNYAFGDKLSRPHEWVVHMKALEAILSFPYRDAYVIRVSKYYIKHHHPLVRRAAVYLLTRAPKHIVLGELQGLIRHPDAGVSRLAVYFHRMCTDREFVKTELARMRKGQQSDHASYRRIAPLFAASCSQCEHIAEDVVTTAGALRQRTSSVKMDWIWETVVERAQATVDHKAKTAST